MISSTESGVNLLIFAVRRKNKMRAKDALSTIFFMTILSTLVWQINAANAAKFITNGLVSYWSFDEKTIKGNTVKDLVGKRDATIKGGELNIVEGKFGDALHFDGNDYLEYDPKGLPEKKEPRTMSVWVRPEGAGVRAVLEWGTRLGGMRCSILIERNERVKFCGEGVDLLTGDAIPLKEWSLITETYDGSTIRIYFDGELIDSAPKALNTTLEGAAKPGFGRIGSNVEVAPGEFMNGDIDEASIYDRMLNDDEVKQNFEAGPLPQAVEPAGKLALTWGKIKTSK